MNIAIQRADSREFLAGDPDDWVRDPKEAKMFPDTRSAVSFCRRHELDDVRLVLFFQNRMVNLLSLSRDRARLFPAGPLKAAAA